MSARFLSGCLSLVFLHAAAHAADGRNVPGRPEELRVAVLQWTHPVPAPLPATVSQAEAHKAGNREELASWARRAAQQGAALLVTPEFGVTGYPNTEDGEDQFATPAEIRPYAETVPGPSTDYFGKIARELGIHLHFDLAEDGQDGHYYNTAVVMGPEGQLLGSYRKRNLFGGEWDFLAPGSGTTVIEGPFGRIGLMICADVYSSPVIRDYQRQDVDLMLVSAAWTVPGAMNSFRSLARSLGAWVAAANLADYPGSGIIRPDGSVPSEIRDGMGLALALVPASGGSSAGRK